MLICISKDCCFVLQREMITEILLLQKQIYSIRPSGYWEASKILFVVFYVNKGGRKKNSTFRGKVL